MLFLRLDSMITTLNKTDLFQIFILQLGDRNSAGVTISNYDLLNILNVRLQSAMV